MILSGVTLLGSDPAPVNIVIENGLIAAISPSTATPSPRLLALPALANAHDHARPLSPTSFGGAGKPLETWLLRLGAMPAIDPYLGALAAFGRAARGGAASVMAHYTRAHGPMSLIDEAREIARAASDVGIRVTFALFMRDRNPLVYGPSSAVLDTMPAEARSIVEAQFLSPMPSASEQIARVEAIAAAVESPTFTVQFGPNGPQWCSDELLGAIADASARTGRRIHMHLLETLYQRAFADRAYPQGVVAHLRDIGLLTQRLTLAHCVHARPDELDLIAQAGAIIATNPSSNLHLRSGIAPIGEAIKRGCRVALGVDASALDEDDDILREMRLGHFLHGGWGFENVIERGPWLETIVAHGRFANGAPGAGALKIGEPADILVLDLDRLDRDGIMPVAPVDLVFARASMAHVARLIVAAREIVRDGRLTGPDLDAAHAALRESYRRAMPSRQPFLNAWTSLEAGAAQFYRGQLGCC
ncbi:amidohydrolase family protein [Methylocapsa sp. S129]|uniref:amidohydrolase family protein n=1 Tax=Methylocapsa sp. S129 TaxID=1641869 RepID=UPI00131C0ADA|nr:amidohydrolase family protein [Methylocapsa sp. S129]